MGLSELEQKRTVRALDYPAKVLVADSLQYNTWVLRQLQGYDEYETAEIMSMVEAIENQKDVINSGSGSGSKDNIKRIDDIEFDTQYSRSNKTEELSRLQRELALYVGLPYRGGSMRSVSI